MLEFLIETFFTMSKRLGLNVLGVFVTLLMGGLPPGTESFAVSPGTKPPTVGRLFWSFQVELDAAGSIEEQAYSSCSYVVSEVNGPLASPRKWLEHSESMDGREGAYTVMRCDLLLVDSSNQPQPQEELSWRVWGKEFHKKRLLSSYKSLLSYSSLEESEGDELLSVQESDRALTRTEGVISSLLDAAARDWSLEQEDNARHLNENSFLTLMLTILWVPVGDNNNKTIHVRAHGCHTGQVVVAATTAAEDYRTPPITASVVTIGRGDNVPSGGGSWPNRYETLPRAKLSSWCRRRTPLETHFKKSVAVLLVSKTNGDDNEEEEEDDVVDVVVDEVLLTRRTSFLNKDDSDVVDGDDGKKKEEEDDYELLEGLTSNLFILYRDGSLRTPPADNVLGGYGRHLVLKCAASATNEECGAGGVSWNKVMQVPIYLSEAPQWKEVFMTSAIRLLLPVTLLVQQQQQLVVDVGTTSGGTGVGGGNECTTTIVWKKSSDEQEEEPCWKILYLKLMESAGQAE